MIVRQWEVYVTEHQWLTSTDSRRMLHWLRFRAKFKLSARKLRLFACGRAHLVWKLLIYPQVRDAVAVAERHADRLATREELALASEAAWLASIALARSASQQVVNVAQLIATATSANRMVSAGLKDDLVGPPDFYPVPHADTFQAEERADLVREIFGNPFRAYTGPTHWKTVAVTLAEALYAGEDCAFALHDALLESGHAELAEHLQTPWHPKGCWVVDLLLGKN